MLGTIRTGKNEVVVVDIKVCDSVGYGLQFVICWWWYFYFFWGGKYGGPGGGGGILFLSIRTRGLCLLRAMTGLANPFELSIFGIVGSDLPMNFYR